MHRRGTPLCGDQRFPNLGWACSSPILFHLPLAALHLQIHPTGLQTGQVQLTLQVPWKATYFLLLGLSFSICNTSPSQNSEAAAANRPIRRSKGGGVEQVSQAMGQVLHPTVPTETSPQLWTRPISGLISRRRKGSPETARIQIPILRTPRFSLNRPGLCDPRWAQSARKSLGVQWHPAISWAARPDRMGTKPFSWFAPSFTLGSSLLTRAFAMQSSPAQARGGQSLGGGWTGQNPATTLQPDWGCLQAGLPSHRGELEDLWLAGSLNHMTAPLASWTAR